jgi:hypothetical protein
MVSAFVQQGAVQIAGAQPDRARQVILTRDQVSLHGTQRRIARKPAKRWAIRVHGRLARSLLLVVALVLVLVRLISGRAVA